MSDFLRRSLRNSLLMGALGDAMGYQIEFSDENEIDSLFDGDVTFDKFVLNELKISDDTQMSLFTLDGIFKNPPNPIDSIYQCYMDWCWTQLVAINPRTKVTHPGVSSLADEEVLRQAQAPGMTCMDAIMSGKMGTIETRINFSKGCGGVMRLAPLAVYYAIKSDLSVHEISKLGEQVSCITHGHDLSNIASYHWVYLMVTLIRDKEHPLERVVIDSLSATKQNFNGWEDIVYYEEIILKAIELSKNSSIEDRKAISLLGEGWVAEETVGIALYSLLKYYDKPKQALVSSVNHKGDSDSSGILVGNVLGLAHKDLRLFEPIFKQIDAYEVIETLLDNNIC